MLHFSPICFTGNGSEKMIMSAQLSRSVILMAILSYKHKCIKNGFLSWISTKQKSSFKIVIRILCKRINTGNIL